MAPILHGNSRKIQDFLENTIFLHANGAISKCDGYITFSLSKMHFVGDNVSVDSFLIVWDTPEAIWRHL